MEALFLGGRGGGRAEGYSYHASPVLHRPQKKTLFRRFFLTKSTTGSTSTCVIFLHVCTIFRNSAITPATTSIRKRTTRRWTLWCSHYTNVAKQQQFSCPVSWDIVAEVSTCGSSGLDLIFPVLYPSTNFTAGRAGASSSRGN